MEDMQTQLDEMRAINELQEQWQDDDRYHASSRESLAQQAWARLRNAVGYYRRDSLIEQRATALQRRWLGDLSDKKVLDLGHGGGNVLSLYMAREAGDYHALDLCEEFSQRLRERAESQGITDIRSDYGDFLSEDYSEQGFDVIFAVGVAHHFKHFGAFLQRARERLAPGGVVITYDPLNEFLPLKVVRACYRPFQSDREWEWPFTRDSFTEMRQFFSIEEAYGFLGASKWAAPLWLLNPRLAREAGLFLDRLDERFARGVGRSVRGCLHISCLLRRLD